MNYTLYLLIAVIILQCLDVWTTNRILSKGGQELNKFMAWIFDKLGVLPGLLAIKVPLVALFCYLYYLGGEYATIALGLIAVVYVGVITFNSRSL